MKYIKVIEAFEQLVTETKVENSEILDVIDSIQNLIKNIKTDSSKKGTKLFTAASPLVKELHKLVESVQESFDNVATQVPAETIAVTEGTGKIIQIPSGIIHRLIKGKSELSISIKS